MKNLDFMTKIVEPRIDALRLVLRQRGTVYSGPTAEDRLHNFKVAGRMDDISPEEALWGMYRKHHVLLKDLLDMATKSGDEVLSIKLSSLFSEVFNDMHNYLFLLEGLVSERKGY